MKWLRGVLSPFGLLMENIKSLIAFEIVFRILCLLVLFPLLSWAQKLWLIGNKTRVIAWYNAGSFVKNPITWIVLIAMILLLAAAAMFEQFAIYDMLHASNFELRRTTRQIFSSGFDMCVERLRPGNWVFVPYVYLVLHFGNHLVEPVQHPFFHLGEKFVSVSCQAVHFTDKHILGLLVCLAQGFPALLEGVNPFIVAAVAGKAHP